MKELGPAQGHKLSLLEQEPSQEYAGLHPEVTVKDFLSILRRRKTIAVQTLVTVVAMAAVVTFITPPAYRSVTRILVEGKAATIALTNNNDDPLIGDLIPPAGHDVNTQVEILRSPLLLNRVANEIKANLKQVSVDVRQVASTDVIELSATSKTKSVAENFAKAMPLVYLQDVRKKRLREVTSALSFATRRLKERRIRLRQSEQQMANWKGRSRIIDANKEISQDIDALGDAKAKVRNAAADAASAQARYDAFRNARNSLPSAVVAQSSITNPQIAILEQQIAALTEEKRKAQFLYTDDQPQVRTVQLQLDALTRRLQALPRMVSTRSSTPNPLTATYDQSVSEAQAAARAAQANYSEAQARLKSVTTKLLVSSPIERDQTQLQRDIDEDRDAVGPLASTVEKLSLRQKATESKDDPITVIAQAQGAAQVSPNIVRNMVLAIFLGLLLAGGAAMLQDSLDDHINNEEETRSLLNVTILGHLPLLPERESRLISLKSTDSSLLERFRMVRSNVQFTLVNRPSQVLMVTSTVPEEGKSSTAANLAVSIAIDGRRVILVDADLHRPMADKLFDIPRQPGLTNVLVGQSTLEEALQESGIPGLRLLTAGVLPPNPAELLNSPSMDQLIQSLKDSADMIIFDTPPCLATADAQVLSAKVDGVVYVMQLGKVRKSAVQRSFELLYQARAHVLGVVFNKVPENDRDHYSYNYGYYGRRDDDREDDQSIETLKHASFREAVAAAAKNTSSNGTRQDHITEVAESPDVDANSKN